MGAYPLEDHKLVHRALGISRLIAFDFDDGTVARQQFNKPVSQCYCVCKRSDAMIAGLDRILSEAGFGDPAGLIVWLDYTDPSKIGAQIREFQSLLDRLAPGDIVRVTVNAHPQSLSEPSDQPQKVEVRRVKQFEAIQKRLGDLLPSRASPSDMTTETLPALLAEAFAAAALRALPVSSPNAFRPLSVTRYKDGQQMLSLTGAVVAKKEEHAMQSRIGLDEWPFSSPTWSKIHNLVVPDLTVRERLFLEREAMSKSDDQIISALGFNKAGDVPMREFLDNYRNYYRFYPILLAAEL